MEENEPTIPKSPSLQGSTPLTTAKSVQARSLLLIRAKSGAVNVKGMNVLSGGIAGCVFKVRTPSVVSPEGTSTGRRENEAPPFNSHEEGSRGTPGQTNTGAVAVPCSREHRSHESHRGAFKEEKSMGASPPSLAGDASREDGRTAHRPGTIDSTVASSLQRGAAEGSGQDLSPINSSHERTFEGSKSSTPPLPPRDQNIVSGQVLDQVGGDMDLHSNTTPPPPPVSGLLGHLNPHSDSGWSVSGNDWRSYGSALPTVRRNLNKPFNIIPGSPFGRLISGVENIVDTVANCEPVEQSVGPSDEESEAPPHVVTVSDASSSQNTNQITKSVVRSVSPSLCSLDDEIYERKCSFSEGADECKDYLSDEADDLVPDEEDDFVLDEADDIVLPLENDTVDLAATGPPSGPPADDDVIVLDDWFPRDDGTVNGRVYNHPETENGTRISIVLRDLVLSLVSGNVIASEQFE